MSFRDENQDQYLQRLMRHPATVFSRIFIGNLPPGVEKKELEEKFGKHGRILGIILNRNFAFLQFEEEQSAFNAIKEESGTTVMGKKIDVKAARVNKNEVAGTPDKDVPERDNFRERSPVRGGPDDRGPRGPKRDWRDRDRFDGPGFGGGRGGYGRGGRDGDRYYGRDDVYNRGPPDEFRGLPDDYRRVPDDFRGPPEEFRGPPDGFRGPPDDFRGPPPIGPERERNFDGPYRGGMDMRGLPPRDYPPHPPPVVASSDRTNDCEIIVVNKKNTEYAEFLERRLQKLGLTVDLLFPNEEVPLGRVLANISGRGTLYAIVVTPENEELRSLTLNILYGHPQEHRNMPVEDAIAMIARNFDLYMRGEKGLGPGPVPVVPAGGLAPNLDRHPEAIQTLLNLLKENRQLTVLQYDKVIRYLQEKREMQVRLEVGDEKGLPPPVGGDSTKQAELQHRILNILNQGGSTGSGGENSPVPPPSPWNAPPAAPAPLLKDPSVQKALDSLMQGDLLRKLNPGPTGPPPPSQPLFGAYAGPPRKY